MCFCDEQQKSSKYLEQRSCFIKSSLKTQDSFFCTGPRPSSCEDARGRSLSYDVGGDVFFVLQLQEQLDAVDSVLDLCTPHLNFRLEEVQQEVVERWEELRRHAERREDELKLACQRYLFLNTVKTDGRTDERLTIIINPIMHLRS